MGRTLILVVASILILINNAQNYNPINRDDLRENIPGFVNSILDVLFNNFNTIIIDELDHIEALNLKVLWINQITVSQLSCNSRLNFDSASNLAVFNGVLPEFNIIVEVNNYFNVPIRVKNLRLDANIGFRGNELKVFNPSVNYDSIQLDMGYILKTLSSEALNLEVIKSAITSSGDQLGQLIESIFAQNARLFSRIVRDSTFSAETLLRSINPSYGYADFQGKFIQLKLKSILSNNVSNQQRDDL